MPAQEFETGNLTIAAMDPTAFGQEFKPSAGSIVIRWSTVHSGSATSARVP